jgi:hypothetical protein
MDEIKMKIGLHVIPALISVLLLGGCASDFISSSGNGTHIRLTNMSLSVIEFNLTDKYEYNFENIMSTQAMHGRDRTITGIIIIILAII